MRRRKGKKDGKNHIYGRSVGRNSGCYYFAVQIVINKVVMRAMATLKRSPIRGGEMIVDITKQRESELLDNLIKLHGKLCEEGGNVYDVIELTKYLNKLLKKQDKRFNMFSIVGE